MLGDVNKLFVFKTMLTTPSNVLPLHLKQTFSHVIWIFTECEGDGIKSRLPFEIFSTLKGDFTVEFPKIKLAVQNLLILLFVYYYIANFSPTLNFGGCINKRPAKFCHKNTNISMNWEIDWFFDAHVCSQWENLRA